MFKILLSLGFMAMFFLSYATHNRAGEITFEHISGYTYKFTVLTYTYSISFADRPSLTVDWGDGSNSIVNRYQKVYIGNYTNKNKYSGNHTFTGPGTFVVSIEDPNRNGGVTNIPNSVNVPFYIETVVVINPFIGVNNSVQLLNPPIDNGCVGYPFYHNPSAYDPDGDSLSYSLAVCKGSGGINIPGFTFPVASYSLSINPITGTFTWDSPTQQGEYNIAIIINEFRFGVFIGSVRRDMQITIASCNNDPPIITTMQDTCVEVDSTISINVISNDINNDIITLTGSGGPIILPNNPASFSQPTYGMGSVSSIFSWTPSCSEVQKQAYQMTFKAKDNGSPVNLVDIKTLRIKVVATSPKNLQASSQGNSIKLKWNKHHCQNVKRYDIYRHQGYLGYVPSSCETGVPAWTGYVKIGSTNSNSDTSYIDNDNGYGLLHGNDYCYMIVALFPDSAESYPSLEACASLSKDVPVMTHVTVDSTDKFAGKITLKWSKPSELDTIAIPGPYKYLIYHSEGKGNLSMILIDSLNHINDTVYQAIMLNTSEIVHNFKIDFINNQLGNRYTIGNTQTASSVYIKLEPSDKQLKIVWDEDVPWNNKSYIIYKQNITNTFDSIATTTNKFYIDSNLVNATTYCYKIKSLGEYFSNSFTKPLINFSQINCGIPKDITPPCAPILNVNYDCQQKKNYITWNIPSNKCAHDITQYKLFFTPFFNGDFTEIYFSTSRFDTSYTHAPINSIAGCYSVVAIDSNGNQSNFSSIVCVDIDGCNPYVLPNVFTPNGDNFNDFFHPFPYDYVEKIDLKIYNRWGALVFVSNDPNILWDGKDMNSKNDCSEGVYFYVCTVFEQRLEGIIPRDIKGTITLYRNK